MLWLGASPELSCVVWWLRASLELSSVVLWLGASAELSCVVLLLALSSVVGRVPRAVVCRGSRPQSCRVSWGASPELSCIGARP